MYTHAHAANGTTKPSTTLSPNAPNESSPSNAWSTPGPAAFDLRSDTITTPTLAMLSAIQSTTLRDDVFREDPTTSDLEALCADLAGHPAGLLVLSGTMGNQVAIRTHLGGPPHSVLTDHRSHILVYEAGGVASLSGALVLGVRPANGHHLTLEDVVRDAVVSEDVHACPTKLVSLENTLNGTIMPLAEVRRIAGWAHERGILVHMDGARLWEAVVAGAGSLREYASAVDSVSLCFSKGLGAPIGSVIVGSEAFVKRARWVRKSIGGGTRMAGIITAAARVGIEETFLGGGLKAAQQNARRVAELWEGCGGKLQYKTETNMVWLDLEAHGIEVNRFIELASRHGLRTMGGRLVVHYQICEEAIAGLEKTFKELLGVEESKSKSAAPEENPEALKIETE